MNAGSFLHTIQHQKTCKAYLIKSLLWFCASVYGVIIRLRNFAYHLGILKINKLPTPVISLGNITAGGTGKTPAAVWLCKVIQKEQLGKAILLSRGYGQDEVKLLEQLLPDTPHFVNSNRFAGGLQALEAYPLPVVFVLDDGFQHRKLHRDLDIVLVDAGNPFGYGHILPRGFLREPLSNIRRADAIVITKTDSVTRDQVDRIRSTLEPYCSVIAEANHQPCCFQNLYSQKELDCDALQNKKTVALCGIGNPKSFIHNLEKLQLNIVATKFFPDHHPYQQRDLDSLESLKENADIVVTTAKDAVKLRDLQCSMEIWVLQIEFVFSQGESQLHGLICKKAMLKEQ